ncbi:MAG: DMT family transporter [Proteobacteria bacterium]|nr:DMT family transporter [Pseudomonadota bacterium]
MSEPNCKSLGRENIVGSCLMILSMAAFAGEDSVIKALSEEMPVSQIIFLIGIGGASVFAITGVVLKTEILVPEINSLPMHARIVTEIFGRIFYSLALSLTSLSSTTMILQATPLVVVIGASIFFNEKVGVVRWLAIGLGFVGVLMIISPEEAEFSLLSLMAIFGMLGFAFRDLASRAASPKLNIFTLGCHGFLSLAVAGIILSLILGQSFLTISGNTWLFLAAGVSLGVVGYGSLISAMRIGEVSAITPFRYTRLIFGLSIGYFIFNEHVGINAAIGCVLIVLSSFTVLYRGRTR